MESYGSILKRMEEAYTEKSGCAPEAVSDIGLRLRVLAGELYRCLGGIEWLKRQAFPQTAEGEYLDMHGGQRGVARRKAERARGEITFTRYVPITFDLLVPKGTLCACAGEAAEYETTEDAVLEAGQLSVSAPAQAVLPGPAGNAAQGYINTLVTPVAGIEYASNRTPFTGGAGQEEDGPYRARVLAAYARPVNSGNAGYYEALALEVPGIASAQAVASGEAPGQVDLYVWGEGAAPDEGAVAQVQALADQRREVGIVVTVKAASAKAVNIYAYVTPPEGMELADVKGPGEAAIKAWLLTKGVGDPVYVADVSRVILEAAPVTGLSYPVSVKGLAATAGVAPVAGSITLGRST